MYEEGLTARKVATFDSSIFDEYRKWESTWDWNPSDDPLRYLRVGRRPQVPGKKVYQGDGTYVVYLPVSKERNIGFWDQVKSYPEDINHLWESILKPVLENKILPLTGIADPVIVQADMARMPPKIGDTKFHTDTRINQRYARRYNIAVSTNTECWLYHYSHDLNNGGTRDHISEGELWELNNKIMHTAVNHGDTWRTHLIIDVMPKQYFDRMCELYNPYDKVPNPLDQNHTYDLDINGKLIDEPLFTDLPHCFSARTHI